MQYNKLVRDNIPEIIKKKGGVTRTHIAADAEYLAKLKEKLSEEVKEFLEATDAAHAAEELADILEVIYALGETKNASRERLESLRRKKSCERGAFKQKIILEES